MIIIINDSLKKYNRLSIYYITRDGGREVFPIYYNMTLHWGEGGLPNLLQYYIRGGDLQSLLQYYNIEGKNGML